MSKELDLKKALRLYFVMGSQDIGLYDPLTTLEIALKAGVSCYQWREKGPLSLKEAERIAFAQAARRLCANYHVPFFVDDDVELALKLSADGVHVGQKDEGAQTVRRRIGTDMWLGVSVHSLEEAEHAHADGADYIGVGPYKPTQSKADAESPVGDKLFRELTKRDYPLPTVAIGGVTPNDVSTILSAGAAGVAVISAISKSPDPAKSVDRFLSELNMY
ncbi:thiamine phosphate synthase [Sporolactobacillus shoreicorticis]|uniref:Thiamine-phosphate synthase n=1 Tax=Sporolactobacillus shoreicorticis TaxID=1923877 RepID=A0ABW5S950_9BACL|nr:thiamine phosphate synthase [Sporolactobacillus shoreicorticis]MCO7126853.1 thiamine phosphate synthase [Sporolactobacillus shoreicorticis]